MKKAAILRSLVLTAIIFIIGASAAFAAVTGTVSGIVRATSGEPVADVEVTLSAAATAPQQEFTDSGGHYVFQGVSPGTYTVKADKETFQSAQSTVSVAQDQTTNLDFNLEKAVISSTSHIHIATVQRNRVMTSATLTAKLEEETKSQPNELYQFPGLVFGQPGVTYDSGQYPHIRGDDQNQNGFEVDGVPITGPLDNQFSTNIVSVGMRSMNLITGGADASYGGATGGFINEVTENGRDFATGDKLNGGHIEATFGPGHGWDYQGTHDEFGGISPDGRLDYYLATIMFKNNFPGNTQISSLPSSFDGLMKFNFYPDSKNTVTGFISQGFENYVDYVAPGTPAGYQHYNLGAASSVTESTPQTDHSDQHYNFDYASYKHTFTPKSFLTYRLYYLDEPVEFHLENILALYEYNRDTQLGNQVDYTNSLSSLDTLNIGASVLRQEADFRVMESFLAGPGLAPISATNPYYIDLNSDIQPTQTTLYLSNSIHTADQKVNGTFGVRYSQDHFDLRGAHDPSTGAAYPNYTDHYLDPRLGATYSPDKDLVFRTSYSTLSQFPDTASILSVSPESYGFLTPTALNGSYAAEQSAFMQEIQNPYNQLGTEHTNDFDLGVDKGFTAQGGVFDLSVTGYKRYSYDNIQSELASYAPQTGLTVDQSIGHGHSSGVETVFTKKAARQSDWNGFVSYTNQVVTSTSNFIDTNYSPYFANAFEGVPGLNEGDFVSGNDTEYPTSYAQRHTIAVVMNKRINKWFEPSLLLDAGSGSPFKASTPTGADAQHDDVNVYGASFYEAPVTMPDGSLQPLDPIPGQSGWHYKITLNTNIYLTQNTNLFFNVDNIFDKKTVLNYGTETEAGQLYYLQPTPEFPEGRVYYGPSEIITPIFVSFGCRVKF
jgi:hypothetical protein